MTKSNIALVFIAIIVLIAGLLLHSLPLMILSVVMNVVAGLSVKIKI